MSKLNIDQKTVKGLFSDTQADYLIPDYQRPYAWEDTECQTLWDDLFAFAIPEDDASRFKREDKYYLGPIVTFKNEGGKQEIIDGQQRLTSLLLLLRAFYERSSNQKDSETKSMRKMIEQCIWKTDEFDKPDQNALKIDSQVATDDDKGEFLEILKSGKAHDNYKSQYAENYRFFEKKIDEFVNKLPGFFKYLPVRILNNCILLPIEAENQDTALQIFSTLNDRGKPLSDADIFKAQFYKHYSAMGQKEDFIDRWNKLADLASATFKNTSSGSPMDELFTRYMYYQLALQGNTNTSTGLRKFYERDNYALLKKEQTLEHIEALADFWSDVRTQDEERFSDKILRRLFVLNYAPNSMWTYFVSVYFLHHRQPDGLLEEAPFFQFLEQITAFIWAYTLTHLGVDALRKPVFYGMVQIVRGQTVTFANDDLFERENFVSVYNNFRFHNQRPITKSMLAWWAFQFDKQELLDLGCDLHTEHIYARKRAEMEPSATIQQRIELLGNKSLLEEKINITASNYHFVDKARIYKGLHRKKAPTRIHELLEMADQQTDFTEDDIVLRNERILNGFIDYLDRCGLLKG